MSTTTAATSATATTTALSQDSIASNGVNVELATVSSSTASGTTTTSNNLKLQLPSSSTFSFKAPFPQPQNPNQSSSSSDSAPLKQRRVSLALASSPRVVPTSAWSFRDDTTLQPHRSAVGDGDNGDGFNNYNVNNATTSCLMPEKRGKMRRIAADVDDEDGVQIQEKKQRKKWSKEETQMLVDGCNRHGVGNWKVILSDPDLKFDSRSPVDLKDRFRTYFPDAYKQHYPNARTHLSSKVRATQPDGTSLFEKTRSKKRRPFTEEEDRALKAGYEKHGTVWATIVKDPVFQEQNRRSTDLRDRFRNAFPELYQAAGYKPRNAVKKKLVGAGGGEASSASASVSALGLASGSGTPATAISRMPMRAATDDQLSMSTTGPVRRKRRNTSSGLLRGGTKSVPQSTAPSEDEDSSCGEDDEDDGVVKPSRTTRSISNPLYSFWGKPPTSSSSSPVKALTDDDGDMDLMDTTLADSLSLGDFMAGTSQSEFDAQSQTWSSGLDTPVHSHHTWTGSPTSSHLSADYLMSSQSSPFQRRNESIVGGMGMIGKSAWGTQDWFSANPRLDSSSGSSAYFEGGLSPSSPFSFHNLNHGVFDRYDLVPTSNPHDFSSEIGVGDSRSTLSDEMFGSSSCFRGFTHHSNYAGDLIFGARTHQPQQTSYYGGFDGSEQGLGLGLSGGSQSQQAAGIHPLQLHTPALPGIDEIELTGITLDDGHPDSMDDSSSVDIGIMDMLSPQKEDRHHHHPHQHHQQQHHPHQRSQSVMSDTRLDIDDLVDLSQELHSTPPATPLTQPRQMRTRSVNHLNNHYSSSSAHGRSISVPPVDRTGMGGGGGGGGGHLSRPTQVHANSQPEIMTMELFGSDAQSLDSLGSTPPPPAQQQQQVQQQQQQQQQQLAAGVPSRLPPLPHPPSLPNPPTFSSLFLASQNQNQNSSHSTPNHLNSNSNSNSNSVLGGDMYDLPFLDLHYYGGSSSHGGMGILPTPFDEAQNSRQALDLAQSVASVGKPMQDVSLSLGHTHAFGLGSSSSFGRRGLGGGGGGDTEHVGNGNGNGNALSNNKSVGISIPPLSPPLGSTSSTRPPSHPSHQRGQSAVCPQDLMLRGDNKRKRASWDGAHT